MSGIDNAKQVMGWKAPAQRAGCGNCKHADAQLHELAKFSATWLCGKGGFFTQRHAICDDWADAVGVRG